MTVLAAVKAKLRGRGTGSSFRADLRSVLREQGFRHLFATRLISQAGDGVFTAGLGSYVFFNTTSFPNPASAAAAFAVLYLPYSLVGPFAGVFIDRWSRRQILVWSALIRSVFVILTASLVASGNLGVPLYASVLLVLGVNRFFLSSQSAALPHVVAEDKLVMANSVSPTAGGIMAAVGGIAGLGVHVATGGGRTGSAVTLLAAGFCYVLAGLVARTMARDLLGPNRGPDEARPGRLLAEFAIVATGLIAGARYVLRRRGPAAALGATGSNRFLYGIMFLMSILLYRNYFYRSAGANTALGHYTVLVVASALGYACAALVTPQLTKWLSKPALITVLLVAGAIVVGPLGETFDPAAFLVIGFLANLIAQGVAICTTTILQEQVEDGYRGRVFSFYDMMFNITFVAGAALSAAFMPVTGKSPVIIGLVAAGFALAGAGYWLVGRQPPEEPPGAPSPSPSAQRSSS
ncbi:MAG TPA: MFS transporter [Streptosporangiaceae bacterium]|nr:MFS transporter [Streptosporangiaceae bacterium]